MGTLLTGTTRDLDSTSTTSHIHRQLMSWKREQRKCVLTAVIVHRQCRRQTRGLGSVRTPCHENA